MPAVHRPLETRARFLAAFGFRPVTTAEARSVGLTRASLRHAVGRGLLVVPRRGLLVAAAGPPGETTPPGVGETRAAGAPDWQRLHIEAIRAALVLVSPRALASHDSAAVLHGQPRPTAAPPSVVSLIVPGGVDFSGPGLRVRGSGVPLHHRTTVHGIPVTTPARTAVDLARGRRLASALIPLDGAARMLVSTDTGAAGNELRRAVRDRDRRQHALAELERALGECFGWPGTVAVRDALRHTDPAAESPLESRSRGWFLEAGFGPLDPGAPIACGGTTYWADFCEPTRRVIGEADGWAKYGETLDDVRSALERERRRQRRLEADGWRFVRWSSTDSRRAVVARMSAALGGV
jgi:hypothetical protein